MAAGFFFFLQFTEFSESPHSHTQLPPTNKLMALLSPKYYFSPSVRSILLACNTLMKTNLLPWKCLGTFIRAPESPMTKQKPLAKGLSRRSAYYISLIIPVGFRKAENRFFCKSLYYHFLQVLSIFKFLTTVARHKL